MSKGKKKSVTKRKAASKISESVVKIPGVNRLVLSKEHLFELEMTHSRLESVNEGVMRRREQAKNILITAQAQAGILEQEAQGLERQRHELKDDHKRLLNRLSEEYEVDFNQVTYDNETGVITLQYDPIEEARRKKKEHEEKVAKKDSEDSRE